ncbi:MAG: helix-turn-helix transcriptional regulator [Clostridia bacterium]|nr:helix-turn-helix transcriptional regulator [Clostridia bacterium]
MNETISKTIGQNINALLSLRKKKQKELAEFLSVPDNTISYFVSGKRMPNTEQIIKMTEFFNTTADYLLGLSVVPDLNTDVETKQICDYTGLSEKAISILNYGKRKLEEEDNFSEIINKFIEECSSNLSLYVSDYSTYNLFCSCYDKKNDDYNEKQPLTAEDEKILDNIAYKYADYNNLKDLSLFRLQELIKDFTKKYADSKNTRISRIFTCKVLACSDSGSDCSDSSDDNSEGGV